MYKTKVYILICLSMILPVFLFAAPIDKYYVPPIQLQQQAPQQQIPWQQQQIPSQQQTPNSRAQTGGSDVDTDFRNKVSSLSDVQKKELKDSLEKERDNATNTDVKKYYQDLIDILN